MSIWIQDKTTFTSTQIGAYSVNTLVTAVTITGDTFVYICKDENW